MTHSDINANRSRLTRRGLLKGAAVGAGAAIGSGAMTGFPTIWAQNIKDMTLIHIGGSYACIKEIADQASKDLGFKVEMQVVDPATQLNRALTQPKSFDINNIDNRSIVCTCQGKRRAEADPGQGYKLWDKTVPIFTKGEYPDGRPIATQGLSPIKIGFWTGPDGKKLANRPTDWLTWSRACSTPTRSASAPT